MTILNINPLGSWMKKSVAANCLPNLRILTLDHFHTSRKILLQAHGHVATTHLHRSFTFPTRSDPGQRHRRRKMEHHRKAGVHLRIFPYAVEADRCEHRIFALTDCQSTRAVQHFPVTPHARSIKRSEQNRPFGLDYQWSNAR